jgi:histidinol-phosphate aminotransferase
MTALLNNNQKINSNENKMTTHPIAHIVRPHILAIQAYVSARSTVAAGSAEFYIDANEMPWSPLAGRDHYRLYPEQQPKVIVDFVSQITNVPAENILITRGGDDAIELCIRTFCRPGVDNMLIAGPTFPMYHHHARVNEAAIIEVPLTDDFTLDAQAVINAANENTRVIFLCSPNNPTGTLLGREAMKKVLDHFAGKALVVVDEAYIDFADDEGFLTAREEYPHMLILRTLSKSHAAAGLRIGILIGDAFIISTIRKILPTYPMSVANIEIIAEMNNPKILDELAKYRAKIRDLRDEFLHDAERSAKIKRAWPSASNFVLVRVEDGPAFYNELKEHGIIARQYVGLKGLENCVRITIGNEACMARLKQILQVS